MLGIISDNEIDVDLANEFLYDNYSKIDLLAGIPSELTEKDIAFLLNVSEITITRMHEENRLELTKKSLLDYIFRHFLYLEPIEFSKNTPNQD